MVEVPTLPGSPLGALGSPQPLCMPALEGIASKCRTYVIDGVSVLRTCSHLLHPAPQQSAAPPATPTAVPGMSSSSTHSLFRLVLSSSLAHPRAPRHCPIARAHEHIPLTPSRPPSAASLTHLRAISSTQMLSSCHHGLAHLCAPCHAPLFHMPIPLTHPHAVSCTRVHPAGVCPPCRVAPSHPPGPALMPSSPCTCPPPSCLPR